MGRQIAVALLTALYVAAMSPMPSSERRGVRAGRRSTIGNRVCAKSVSGVRIPASPPFYYHPVLLTRIPPYLQCKEMVRSRVKPFISFVDAKKYGEVG